MHKYSLKLLAVLLLVVSVVMGASGFYWYEHKSHFSAQNVNLYFIIHANSGMLALNPEKTGHYFLTLYNVNPEITYFSDRPERIAGVLPLKKLSLADSEKIYESFSGVLSYYNAEKYKPQEINANLASVILEIDSYQYVAKKHQIICKVRLANPAMQAKFYYLKDVILQFNGNWFSLDLK